MRSVAPESLFGNVEFFIRSTHILIIIDTDDMARFKEVAENEYVSVKIELEGKIASSEISIEYAGKIHWRLVWQKVSKKLD